MTLTLGQQLAAGDAAAGCGALIQQGLVGGVAVMAQPVGREVLQEGVDAAVGAGYRRNGDGVVAVCQPGFKVLLIHFLYREEEGEFPLPDAVDGFHRRGQPGIFGYQDGDAHQIFAGHSLAGRPVEGVGAVQRRCGITGGFPVVHTAHRQTIRYKAGGGGVDAGIHRQRHGLLCSGSQRLPQLGVCQGGVLGVEQQTPGGIRITDGAQAGVGAGGVQSGGAALVEDQILGALGGAGVLDQTQRIYQTVPALPPEEQAAGGPVVEVEGPAGQGGVAGQAIAAAGAAEKVLVAGHGPRQSQLGDKIIVRFRQGKNQGQGVSSPDANLLRTGCPCQGGFSPFDG